MANQRLVNTNFWKDTYVIDLDPVQKLLFLYFLTNPRTSLAGVYEISLREVAFDTGIDKDMVEKILQKFCADGKMYYEKGWLVLRNFVKHQRINPSIQKGIEKAMAELPTWLREIVENFSAFYDQQRLDLPDSPQSGADWRQVEKYDQNGRNEYSKINYKKRQTRSEITEVGDSLTPDSPQSATKEAKRKEENINKTHTPKAQAREIVEFYNQTFGREISPLDSRLNKIVTRLRSFNTQQIQQAIMNASLDDFFNGGGSREWVGDLDYLVRNDSNLEKYLQLNPKPKKKFA